MATVALCLKCNEIEPHDWNFNDDGLWLCSCRTPAKQTNDKKPIDAFFDELGDTDE